METVSRTDAQKQGSKTYFTGSPCKHGHVSERFTSNGNCTECVAIRKASARYKVRSARRRARAYQENADRERAYSRRWKQENRALRTAQKAKRRADERQRTPEWADLGGISVIYEVARRVAHKRGEEFHVDHVAPLNGKSVCGLHVPENLQILPARENLQKSNRWNGV